MTPARPPAGKVRIALALSLVAGILACPTPRQPPTDQPSPDTGPIRAPSTRVDRPADRPPTAEIPRDEPPRVRAESPGDVRIGLATAAQEATLAATGAWRLFDGKNAVLVRGRPGEEWTVERRGRQLRATLRGTSATSWVDGPITLRPEGDASYGTFAGRRYRGVMRVVTTDSGLVVVNVLPVEQYLRGVVPLEIGLRAPAEQAAAEAQAIAARSYSWVHMSPGGTARNAAYDMLAGVSDQVYGGVDAERPFSDAAVRETSGLVIKYNGRTAEAPYHASCGGETASPEEVWKAAPEPYLRRVSDKIPGSANRSYCDIAPRFAWTRAFSADELDAAVRTYLRNFVTVPEGGPGHVHAITIETRTPSGRVGQLVITTDRGKYNLRGNDIRAVLRAPGSEMLNSTYFSLEPEKGRDGGISRVVLRGNGYGHGIGMCQWGAIGRARAGQTARAILATYYPGTTVGPAN